MNCQTIDGITAIAMFAILLVVLVAIGIAKWNRATGRVVNDGWGDWG